MSALFFTINSDQDCDVEYLAAELVGLSNRLSVGVCTKYKSVTFFAKPGGNPLDLVDDFYKYAPGSNSLKKYYAIYTPDRENNV